MLGFICTVYWSLSESETFRGINFTILLTSIDMVTEGSVRSSRGKVLEMHQIGGPKKNKNNNNAPNYIDRDARLLGQEDSLIDY